MLPDIYSSLGLYLPLIVVNCIILARAESFASKNGVIASACDGLFMGLGFTCALTLIGAVREILGSGAIFGIKLWNFQIGFFASSAGAFFTYAIFIMAFAAITEASKKRKKLKDYAALEQEKHSEEANAATAEIKNSTDNKEAE